MVEVAVKVQYPGAGEALRSDLRQARLLARVMARLTRLHLTGLADELAGSSKSWTTVEKGGCRGRSRPRSPVAFHQPWLPPAPQGYLSHPAGRGLWCRPCTRQHPGSWSLAGWTV
jgi:hypothetical protein